MVVLNATRRRKHFPGWFLKVMLALDGLSVDLMIDLFRMAERVQ